MANADQERTVFAQRTIEAQVERLRAHAALAMVIASVAVGFIAGRASVWLVPFDTLVAANSARQTAVVSRPEAQPGPKAPRPAQPSDGKTSKPPVPLPVVPSRAEQKSVQEQPTFDPPSTARSPATPPDTPAGDSLTAKKSEGKAGDVQKTPTSAVDTRTATTGSEPAVAPDSRTAREGVTLLNPGRVDAGPDAQDLNRSGPENPAGAKASGMVAPAGVEECERRYSSFQRSDGTYQPYGGGPRVRCPLLR